MAMRPRIALATYEGAPDLAPDDQLLLAALVAAGTDAEPAVWSSGAVIWETYDAVIIRSCWDYHRRPGEFRAWLDRLDASRVPAWNTPELVFWNSNKRYLLDLAARGVATIPTVIVPHGRAADVGAIVEAEGWARFVIKPAVSASGFETYALATPLDAAARQIVERVTALGDVLVQPFAEEVSRAGEGGGELSFSFIDGALSHATVKRAAPGEFRVQTEHGGRVDACVPSEELATLAVQAARVLATLGEVPLYARVDGIARGNAFLLMELELIEPNLFLAYSDGAADRFARGILKRIAQS
jgi:glutathione synthase/RimK-type ligase-like ATP-grasp enzyme